jgi:hypothetical protein
MLAAVLIVAPGCGLADYEKRMDEKREQLRLFDEENALLGNLIDMPRGKDAYGNEIKVPFEVFLRLPNAVAATFRGGEAVYYGDKQPLFRYFGRNDVNVFVAWAKVRNKTPDPNSKPAEDEIPPEDFRAKVRLGLIDFITREYKGTVGANIPSLDKLKADPRKALRDGKEQVLQFESIEFADPRVQNPSRFHVHLLTLYFRQAAVIYQAPVQQANQDWQRAADVSLKTLEITPAATSLRSAFGSR